MTALKLVFAVGFLLGAGSLAWTADSVGRDTAVARVKRAAAFIRREAAAFAKFIGLDARDGREIREQPAITAKQPESLAGHQVGRCS